MFDSVPDGYDPNFYGFLVYDEKKALPSKSPLLENTDFDDTQLCTSTSNKWDDVDTYDHVDRQIIIDMDFTTILDMNRYVECRSHWTLSAN
jgi:iron transport multicopper oxidase